jgi:transposase
MMNKEDARYQTLQQLHERRKHVVRLHTNGYAIMTITQLSGLSYPTVRRVIDCYETGGLAAITPAERGRKPGEGRLLNSEQESHIERMLREQTPAACGLAHEVWTRAAVVQLAADKFGVRLTERGVGNYLQRWNFKPQKANAIQRKPRTPSHLRRYVPVTMHFDEYGADGA